MLELANSAAYESGYLFGRLMGGLVMLGISLGIAIFFVIALVKACTRKSGGWIAASIVSGLLSFFLAVGTLGSLAQEFSRSRQTTGEDSRLKRLESPDGHVELKVPPSWTSMRELNEKASIIAGNGIREQYVMVIESSKVDFVGTLDEFDQASVDHMKSALTDCKVSPAARKMLGDYPARQRTLTGVSKKNNNLFYLHTTVETADGFYQILAWTLRSRESEATPVFDQVLATFHAEAGPPQSKPDPEPGSTLTHRVNRIIANQLGIDIQVIRPDSRLAEDLGADDLDLVEIVLAVEEEFNVEIPDDQVSKLKTPGALTSWLQSKASH